MVKYHKMKIGIIGAGFTGLANGLKLLNARQEVAIFEKDSFPGGLDLGFKNSEWHPTIILLCI